MRYIGEKWLMQWGIRQIDHLSSANFQKHRKLTHLANPNSAMVPVT